MNICYQLLGKFFQWKKEKKDGFTLIELLVVTVIIGILSAIAIPNFINQIGKSRESETKSYLGLIARGQQGYHWEKQTFAPTLILLGIGTDTGVSGKYHTIPNPTDVNSTRVKHQAFAINGVTDQVRNFAIGVYYNSGAYSLALCQSVEIAGTVNVGDNSADDCTNNGIKLR
ncbi:type II secretion system protein [Geminocystis sp. GBBB08]|uniref:type II secretion system protein n=1 Tax=Geminocystis sp. GBBB08 TaxID=2604140 RepID=UPI0027E3215D|nr:type II secretion system protein [Geminocystis sp. GBBB08]MBL1209477.1 type II secretion system protein [Geminocystis sp. GBBB08]